MKITEVKLRTFVLPRPHPDFSLSVMPSKIAPLPQAGEGKRG